MFSNIYFWIVILFCFIGYFLYRFGTISNGLKKAEIEFTGGIILFASFVFMVVSIGWKALLVQVFIFWIIVTPIVELSVSRVFSWLKRQ